MLKDRICFAVTTIVFLLIVVPLLQFFVLTESRSTRENAFHEAYQMLCHDVSAGYSNELPDIVGTNSGQFLCSWRLANLKYILGLASEIHVDEPWDSPYNSRFTPVGQFFCHRGHNTFIFAVTGSETAFPAGGGVRFSDLDDDTIILIEVKDSEVHWMEPGDLLFLKNDDSWTLSHSLGSNEDDAFFVVFADSTIWLLQEDVPISVLMNFFSVDLSKHHDRDEELSRFRINVGQAPACLPQSRGGR